MFLFVFVYLCVVHQNSLTVRQARISLQCRSLLAVSKPPSLHTRVRFCWMYFDPCFIVWAVSNPTPQIHACIKPHPLPVRYHCIAFCFIALSASNPRLHSCYGGDMSVAAHTHTFPVCEHKQIFSRKFDKNSKSVFYLRRQFHAIVDTFGLQPSMTNLT